MEEFPLPGLGTRKAVPRYAHEPLSALRQGALASPKSLRARLRVLPYLTKMGLGEEEVDDDDEEEPKIGYYASSG